MKGVQLSRSGRHSWLASVGKVAEKSIERHDEVQATRKARRLWVLALLKLDRGLSSVVSPSRGLPVCLLVRSSVCWSPKRLLNSSSRLNNKFSWRTNVHDVLQLVKC